MYQRSRRECLRSPERRQPRDDVIYPDDVQPTIPKCSTIFGYMKDEGSKDESECAKDEYAKDERQSVKNSVRWTVVE